MPVPGWWQDLLDRHFPDPFELEGPSFRFRDPAVERQFFEDYQLEPTRFSSAAIGSGLVLYLLFGILDWILFPSEVLGTIWLIRFGIAAPLIALAFALTFRVALEPVLEYLQLAVVQVVAISIVAIMFFAPQPERWLYITGVGILLVYNFNFLRMRFWMAAASSALVLFWVLVMEILDGQTPPAVLAAYAFLLLTLSVPAMAGALISELHARKGFVQARLFEALANTDALTSLPNRRALMEYLEEELDRCRRYGRALSFMMLDVDYFKRVNDEHGHAVGDEVLRVISRRLMQAVRDSDVPARLGGEEFAVVLPETDASRAKAVAERVRRRIGDTPIRVKDSVSVSVSVSVGVVSGPPLEVEGKDLLTLADNTVYEAKANGRNTVMAVRLELGGGPTSGSGGGPARGAGQSSTEGPDRDPDQGPAQG